MYGMRDRGCHVPEAEKSSDVEKPRSEGRALLGVMGMGCPTCATRVRDALLAGPGVLSVQIDLPRGLARVLYDRERTTERGLLDAVAAAGDRRQTYQAVLL